MKQKIFLTSVIAMGFVAPAMAEPSNTDTFPQSGLMQEDYTYTNAATSTNMAGVYEGTVDAVAQYEDVLYQIARGKYLPANSETTIDCDQNGYFCAGDDNGVYYSSSAQGLTQCPSGYGNSGTGASANTDCYRTCSTSDVAHSTGTVNGGYYYGDNNQCSPTACENGWHVKAAVPNLTSLIGASEADDWGYINEAGDENKYIYGITQNGEIVLDYGNKGIIKGRAKCSTRSATDPWVGNNGAYVLQSDSTTSTLPESSGEYCYCHLDSYTPYGSNTAIALSAPWVFRDYEGYCEYSCADNCAYSLGTAESNYLPFRAGVFGSVAPGLASCEANTITINWDGASATEINANDAGTATYGSDIRTPRSATPVPGKTFTGWRFSAPQQASVQEP